jgi:signal transduction histidine kinase
MAQLLDEVLLVGRTDSNIFQCNLTELDLVAFCRQLVEETQLNADKQDIEVVFINRGSLGKGVWDQNLLQHILGNLLSNAVKYSPSNSQVQLILIGEAHQAIIKVRDWGIGIPTEDQKHLFEPFHRAGNVGKIPGTGLGLAIVKSCLEPYHGQIEVKSEEGVGTTFTITLPIISLNQIVE